MTYHAELRCASGCEGAYRFDTTGYRCATIAGLRLRELVDGPRPMGDLLAAAYRLERHPDNAAAALFGGLTRRHPARVERALAALYRKERVPCTVRTLTVHE